jgi:uncharacterized protein
MSLFNIAELQHPGVYPHAVTSIQLIQTHISWVCLAGAFAYKIKKPVDFGFLDFSTLARRKALCTAEFELNRRFAPDLYIGVVPIVRVNGELRVDGAGEAIEWAVQMRRFPQEDQLDERLAKGALTTTDLAAFAVQLAAIHERLPRVPPEDFGSAEAVWRPLAENFLQIGKTSLHTRATAAIIDIETWSRQQHQASGVALDTRRAAGFVRECHGDLHLSNLVDLDGHIVAFDCIEFSAGLRWIDVISDVAFLLMDLECRSRANLAAAFIDAYLAANGDYSGARLLGFYKVYRSMVRAKVAALQHDGGSGEPDALRARFDRHIAYASSIVAGQPTVMYLTCGVSGSGKSWLSERLVPRLAAIRIRSDVERKRKLSGASAEYTSDAIADVYDHLLDAAASVVRGGTSVIVDATFIEATQRNRFADLAKRLGVPLRIIYTTAPHEVLEARILARTQRGLDPSDADIHVLELQRTRFDAPQGPEVVHVDTGAVIDIDDVARKLGQTI